MPHRALFLLLVPLLVVACAEADSPEDSAAADATGSDSSLAADGAGDASVTPDVASDTTTSAVDSSTGGGKDGGGAKDAGGTKDAGGGAKDATADAEAFGSCTKTAGSTKDCKACCDCSTSLACADHKACRDTCTALGEPFFAANPSPTPVTAPSSLGAGGDYSSCTGLATEQACKDCCDCSTKYLCGDQGYCRTACTAKFGDAGVSDAASGG